MTLALNGSKPGTQFADGPAFSAYGSALQSIPHNTQTKVQFNLEEFDTAGAYDTTNFRFQPLIPGHYQINGNVLFGSTATTTINGLSIFKNGALLRNGGNVYGGSSGVVCTVSSVVYLNGSTDYLELFVYHNNGSAVNCGGNNTAYTFSGFLARAA